MPAHLGCSPASQEAGSGVRPWHQQPQFSDRADSTRVHAKDGWLRVERTRVAPHRREWRTGKRDTEPENEACSLDKLERRFKSQMHAGAMPKKICRRLSLANRGERFVKPRLKQHRNQSVSLQPSMLCAPRLKPQYHKGCSGRRMNVTMHSTRVAPVCQACRRSGVIV